MAFQFAGRYTGVALSSPGGAPLPRANVYVYLAGTSTLASLYTDRTKATGAANPVVADVYGNFTVWAAPADYDLVCNGGRFTDTIRPDDGDIGSAADSTVVHLAGVETVTGAKAFSTAPTVPTQTALDNSTKAASTGYADAAAAVVQTFAIQRANHTGTQAPSTIVGTALVATQLGAASGVAQLGSDQKLLPGQLPALAFNTVWPAVSQAAMLALAAEPGDVAVRSDINANFMLGALPASTLANWAQLADVVFPTDPAAGVGGLRTLGTGALQAAPGSTSVQIAAPLIDMCSAPFNLSPGSDVTTALQGVINGATSANGGVDIYFSKPGAYTVNGAQQTGTALGYNYSGQILFPAFAYGAGTAIRPTIRIRGMLPGGANAENVSYGQVSLVSNATTGNIFDVIPSATVNGSPTSGIEVLFEDITVVAPTNPQCGGVKLLCANTARTKRLMVTTVAVSGNPTTLTGTGVGLFMPGQNTDGQSLQDTWVEGFPVGLTPGDHCVMSGDNQLWSNSTAINLAGGDNPIHLHCYIGGCSTGITASVPTIVTGEVGFEANPGGAWTAVFINDPNNRIYGKLTVYLDAFVTPTPVPSIFGPNPSLNMARSVNGLDWMSRHPVDTFTRHAAAATTGAAVPGVCDKTLNPWYVVAGGWTISTQGRLQALSSGSQVLTLCKNGGVARVATMNVTTNAGGYNFQMVMQHLGANAITVQLFSGTVTLRPPGGGNISAGVVASGTAYVVALALYYNAAGVPERAKVLLGGATIIDHWLTSSERTALTPTGGNMPYDGFLANDTGTYVTGFTVTDLVPGDATATVQTALAGTTTGTATWEMPYAGGSYKKVLVYLNGYENTTVTAQTITFPTPFINVPFLARDDSGGSTVSATILTLPASMGATKTGWIVVEGY